MAELPVSDEVIKVEPIVLRNSRVTAEIAPEGAFLKSLTIDGEDVIFRPTDENPKRGGVPVLGPTPGPVSGSRWENLYPNMPSHGTDRKTVWEVKESIGKKVLLERTMGPKEFLFNGVLTMEIELLTNGVQISKSITNLEDKPREIGSAFHPYFSVKGDAKFSPETISAHHPLGARKSEIIQPGIPVVEINTNGNSYRVEARPNPVQTVIWSDRPDLYECIEPWWAEEGKGDIIGPRETKKYSLVITKI